MSEDTLDDISQNPPVNPDFGPLNEGEDQRPRDVNPDFGPVGSEADDVRAPLGETAVEGPDESVGNNSEPDQIASNEDRENNPEQAA